MENILFVGALGGILFALLAWGFKHLPKERWQMLAVVPLRKDRDQRWHGVNLTYYGFFVATGQLISVLLLLVLLHSVQINIVGAVAALMLVLAFALPAARIVAMIVEKKRHTFTIGGASFVGIIIAPWAIQLCNMILGNLERQTVEPLPLLAAMSIAYTLGEGLGRLACISYGCCYGKPINECGRIANFLFSKICFIFHGENKKVAYEAQLHGEKLIPIQAITCILYTLGALVGSYLFLNGAFTLALLMTMILTQMWRILSETMRADFRGFSKISPYQKMGIISVVYMVLVVAYFPAPQSVVPNIYSGIEIVWNPVVIGLMQVLWVVFFIVFGRSTVTDATVSINLIRENI